MKKFCIYHKIDPNFTTPPDVIDWEEYEYVATVKSVSLGDTYRITNSIDCAWWKNPEVYHIRKDRNGFRSTSVGDIVVFLPNDFNPEKVTVNGVCGIGWKEVKVKGGGL